MSRPVCPVCPACPGRIEALAAELETQRKRIAALEADIEQRAKEAAELQDRNGKLAEAVALGLNAAATQAARIATLEEALRRLIEKFAPCKGKCQCPPCKPWRDALEAIAERGGL